MARKKKTSSGLLDLLVFPLGLALSLVMVPFYLCGAVGPHKKRGPYKKRGVHGTLRGRRR